MLDVQNRLPTPGKENRVKITQDSGAVVEGVLSYADDATQDGTFWNRKNGQLLQGDIRTYPVRDGESINAGDVVNVEGNIYRDVTPQDNVENTIVAVKAEATAICVLSDTNAIFAQCNSANYSVYLRPVDVKTGNYSGDRISIGTGTNSKNVKISNLNGDSCVVQYIDGSYLRANVVSYESTLTYGTGKDIATSITNTADLVSLTQSSFASIYNKNGINFVVSTVSGKVITLGSTVYPLSGNTGANYISACRLPDDGGNKRVCICFSDTGDSNKGKAVIATISATNAVTFGDVVTWSDTAATYIECACAGNVIYIVKGKGQTLYALDLMLSTLDSHEFASTSNVHYYAFDIVPLNSGNSACMLKPNDSGGNAMARYIDYTDQIIFGDEYQYNSGQSRYPSASIVSDNQILVAYADAGNSDYGTTTILTVTGNQIAGSFLNNSSDAIALADGTGGQSIPVGFGGYCQCDGVTEGQEITSDGVSAFSPIDGWLDITAKQKKQYVYGEYTGNGKYNSANPTIIDVGFSPIRVTICASGSERESFDAIKGAKMVYTSPSSYVTIDWNKNGISFYSTSDASSQMNDNGDKYVYVAYYNL